MDLKEETSISISICFVLNACLSRARKRKAANH